MTDIIELLLYRLSSKGLTPVEIPRLIKDVLNIIGESGEFTTDFINIRLERLGWDKAVLDQAALELIIALLDNEDESEVRSIMIH